MPRLRALRPRPKRDSSQREAEVKDEEDELSNDTSVEQVRDEGNTESSSKATNDNDEQETQNTSHKNDHKSPDKTSEVDEKFYECKSCKPPKRFTYFKSYLQHCKNNHKEKEELKQETIQCTVCPFTTTSQQELESHQKVHQLKRKFFRCAKCSYVTHVRARYTKHVKYHSMPMIKCSSCDFRTPYKWNLDRHTRNHGGGGAYQCRACNFTADIRQSLTVHETNHHEPPVGQPSRKNNYPFERKARHTPKRHNQVGASDYLESAVMSVQKVERAQKMHMSDSESTEVNMPEDRSIMSGADCIALKCEEPGCQFITAWNSEMQRHVAETHNRTNTPNKSKKPLPMLIPLSPAGGSVQAQNQSFDNSSSSLLKVPNVRVRPELAQIARNNEMAKLYGNKKSPELKRDLNFEKKNASFFDKIKERLMTNHANMPEVAVINGNNNLKCWCTFEANNLEELASHKQTHHAALSVSLGVTRCQKCQTSFKSSSELQAHSRMCSGHEDKSADGGIENASECASNTSSFRGEYTFPSHQEWETENSGTVPVEGTANSSGRRVFKCPNCPFWASTASRFHVHIVGHLNRKPFECSLCAYRSNWRWDITKHIKLKAARDPAHMSARVLMTDETGRRNYSKYNKYLAQMEHQSMEDHGTEEKSGEGMNKLISLKDESMELVQIQSQTRNKRLLSLGTRRGQSLLKNKPMRNVTANQNNGNEETKRRLWKCKRCTFRDSNKDVVMQHVKMHYETSFNSPSADKNLLSCSDCPFTATDATTLALHRVHHRPNLEAIFKCYLCPYYVSSKSELLEHSRLHGEELAVVHQKNLDIDSNSLISKSPRRNSLVKTPTSEMKEENADNLFGVTSPTHSSGSSSLCQSSNADAPPFLLDTRALPEAPLVWVSHPNGTLAKMLKCRHCPYVSSRRAEVREHESMHTTTQGQGPVIACSNCSFVCSRRDVMESHAEMHAGGLGTVHCLVDEGRPDPQQVADLAALLGLPRTPPLGPEPDLVDTRLVHCCAKCPARFLCEKELRIHLRYHSTELAYVCQWCSYTARQPAHLLAHQKAHSPEYQERTRYLLSVYGFSQRHPPPQTACLENNSQPNDGATVMNNVAWVVVENNSSMNTVNPGLDAANAKNGNQVFTCAKCPARYFKLDALEYHMTLHGSNNRFKCRECDYSSKTAQNLVKHQVVHRRHTDTFCNPVADSSVGSSASTATTSLQVPSKLTMHHPPDPDFGMFMYGNPNFVYPGYLRNGRLKEKRYKCHKCPSAFEKREQYRVHLTLHGAKQRYRCDICDYSVKYYANYVQHLKKHEANAQAQASHRMLERDENSVAEQNSNKILSPRSAKSLKRSSSIANTNNIPQDIPPQSAQDRQTVMILRKRQSDVETNVLRCLFCPFSSEDKDSLDAHKRRHGIDRLTPSCPHCDYIPRKEETIGDHIKLHFTRLYKPESYVIVELLSLKMRKLSNRKDEKEELLFEECNDGKFLPDSDINLSLINNASTGKEKVIVDPNTGETKHQLIT